MKDTKRRVLVSSVGKRDGKKKMKKLDFKDCYALICSDEKFAPKNVKNRIVCGIYASKKEAQDANTGDMKLCVCKHSIVRGNAVFSYKEKAA